ncbi:uncharacterized protein BJX67DRAFT_345702 [Aspergillus lucknowensis]|uniref:Uncharacterized protein n=1 Tax=Aspergillus lucknowensis TaxID=176173 RepID=A0ABR4M2X2_9EURO
MGFHRKSWLPALVLLAPVGEHAVAQSTDCGMDPSAAWTSCIDPIALGSVSFAFEPLFPEAPTFVYAFDVQNEEELAAESISPGESQAPDAKVSFWLEYSETRLTPSDRQETYMKVLLHQNLTGTPGGAHNGCDEVWGSGCSKNLVRFLKTQLAAADIRHSATLDSIFYDFQGNYIDEDIVSTIGALDCPVGFLNESYSVEGISSWVSNLEGVLATENGDDTSIMSSGNATNTYVTDRLSDTRYEDLIERVAVAIVVRVPLEGDLYQNADNIQLEIACVKAEPFDVESDADNETSEPDSSQEEDGEGSGSPRTTIWGKGAVLFAGTVMAVGLMS